MASTLRWCPSHGAFEMLCSANLLFFLKHAARVCLARPVHFAACAACALRVAWRSALEHCPTESLRYLQSPAAGRAAARAHTKTWKSSAAPATANLRMSCFKDLHSPISYGSLITFIFHLYSTSHLTSCCQAWKVTT